MSQAKYLLDNGQKNDAVESLRSAARSFFEQAEYKHTLEIFRTLEGIPPWRPENDFIYSVARQHFPDNFNNEVVIKFALSRNKWSEIDISHLKDESTATLFVPYRETSEVKGMILLASTADREEIEYSLPAFVGDYYLNLGEYAKSCSLFLIGKDFKPAEQATGRFMPWFC